MEAVSPLVVARQILWLRKQEDTTPMHVIKLVYLSHGWMLGLHDEPLVTDAVEAWIYGPVIPSTYYTYKAFGGEPIVAPVADHAEHLAPQQQSLISEVVDAYHKYTALDLSNITHQEGTPWRQTISRWGYGAAIPDLIIRDFYRRRAEGRE